MIHLQIKDLFFSSVEHVASDISQYTVCPDGVLSHLLINMQTHVPFTCLFTTFIRSSLLYTMVTSFKAYHTDLPRYHSFLPLHPSVSFIMHDSV